MALDKITSDSISPGAVNTTALPDGAITSAKLSSTAISDKLGYTPVSPTHLNDGLFTVSFPSGTKMMFVQTAAPTGWTKDTAHNNKALRVVSGTASSGGTVDFTTAFTNQSVSGTTGNTTATNQNTTAAGTVGGTTLTTSQMPWHEHDINGPTNHSLASKYGANSGRFATFSFSPAAVNSGETYGDRNWYAVGVGGSGSHNHSFSGSAHTHIQDTHNHSFTGTAINMEVQYVDVIIATKD